MALIDVGILTLAFAAFGHIYKIGRDFKADSTAAASERGKINSQLEILVYRVSMLEKHLESKATDLSKKQSRL